MAEFVKLNPDALAQLRQQNPRLVSCNVEMTEVTGGTFWKAYTEAVPVPDFSKGMGAMHQWYDPIDTTNPPAAEAGEGTGFLLGPCVRHLGNPYLL